MPPKGSKLGPPPALPDPESPAMVQQNANSSGIAEYELPKTSLTKLAKGSIPDNVKMQQDVVLALLRSSTMFISYLSAAAHDQAIARSGKSITASDVIKAIMELDFGPADNLVPLLEHELAAYRANVLAAKASKKPAGPGRGRAGRKSNAAASDAPADQDDQDDDEEDMGAEDVDEADDEVVGDQSGLLEPDEGDEAVG